MSADDLLRTVSIFRELKGKELKKLAREANEMSVPVGDRHGRDGAWCSAAGLSGRSPSRTQR